MKKVEDSLLESDKATRGNILFSDEINLHFIYKILIRISNNCKQADMQIVFAGGELSCLISLELLLTNL